jgi:hypothetical protein
MVESNLIDYFNDSSARLKKVVKKTRVSNINSLGAISKERHAHDSRETFRPFEIDAPETSGVRVAGPLHRETHYFGSSVFLPESSLARNVGSR